MADQAEELAAKHEQADKALDDIDKARSDFKRLHPQLDHELRRRQAQDPAITRRLFTLHEEDPGPSRAAEIRKDSVGNYVTSTPISNIILAREIMARDKTPAALA